MDKLLARLATTPDMRAFLVMGRGEGALPEIEFYATTARALQFYANVCQALKRDPDNEGLAVARAAIEKTMGLPPSPPPR
jgi:hypothetical protein